MQTKSLFADPRFWAALLGLLVVIVQAFVPEFALPVADMALLAAVVAGYILGVTIDPGVGGWKGVLISRKFWAAVLMLALLSARVFVPGFTLPTEEMAGMVSVVFLYILGVAVDPGPGGWRGVLLSRKFWAAVVGIVTLLLSAFGLAFPAGLSGDQIVSLLLLIGAMIAGPAIEPLVRRTA